jgi:hypothetical protein
MTLDANGNPIAGAPALDANGNPIAVSPAGNAPALDLNGNPIGTLYDASGNIATSAGPHTAIQNGGPDFTVTCAGCGDAWPCAASGLAPVAIAAPVVGSGQIGSDPLTGAAIVDQVVTRDANGNELVAPAGVTPAGPINAATVKPKPML